MHRRLIVLFFVAATTEAAAGQVVPSSGGCPVGAVQCSDPCACVDDCGDGGPFVLPFGNDVTKAVNIVAGNADLSTCPNADADCDGEVFGYEVTIGVNNIANGCPGQQ